ncbi:CopD family protein [Ornithobacterium rhinotracheale]|uniref:CopD family protein n=1 Tax=Ornithobacterium rhinotracheale TaxID=28251 RepID=UPI00129C9573|nr:CopD family protein [Ornithobacterium rhinotracheale]MRJ08464.1 CopD family protein [Ornithobacterium rhinotracheale]UOH76739.1 CopD family protein [Ornithobacterium rhinotracheale]
MDYSVIKAIHIIFVVSYFAGIFYMVRLFIYHTEALQLNDETEKEVLHKQYCFMEERLWNIITVPALCIMTITGIYLLYAMNWAYLSQGWMHVKLLFILILFVYHYWCWQMIKNLKNRKITLGSVQLRMMNEVATLILFAVVFAVVLKTFFIQYWYWALISFVAMGALIMLIVKLVNKNK